MLLLALYTYMHMDIRILFLMYENCYSCVSCKSGLDTIPGQKGYLVIGSDGAVLQVICMCIMRELHICKCIY